MVADLLTNYTFAKVSHISTQHYQTNKKKSDSNIDLTLI